MALYLSEIIALCLFTFAIIAGLAEAYVRIKGMRRRWRWQDQVNQNNMRRAIMEELDITYEVDNEGFVKPVISERRK
jgi:hypothetical protein